MGCQHIGRGGMELCLKAMLYMRWASGRLVIIFGNCVEGMMCVGLLL
jgi:hypothetical protein